MKALKIDRDGIAEVEGDLMDILRAEISWDSTRLGDAHDIWFDDEGLFAPGCVVATVGEHRRVPLPAYVMGFRGERSTDASMTVVELTSMVRDIQPAD